MKVVTEFIYPPIPIRTHDWTAYFPEIYDGAPDAGPQFVGYGETETDAIRDLCEQISEAYMEAAHDESEARYELRERDRMDRKEVEFEIAARRMNETGQGEHGVTAP